MADKNQSNLYEQSSYNQVPEAGNPTYSEAWALVDAARRMAEPLEFGSLEDPENLGKLRDGLRLNWRLWTIFQTELSLEEGPVPEELRGNMLSLCNFVDKHTVQTLNEPTAEQVSVLIEVNRQIANGLLSSLQNSLDNEEITETNQQAHASQSGSEPVSSIDTEA